ncbi:MAG TPA: bifunctional diguanylate cyclase/phosphodiesterase [Solirubrobacteraceae bacterium]|nr:bifunctional diguanylate cyclase/phosphodiesterase [Solirubrobacteraceae bacterium]
MRAYRRLVGRLTLTQRVALSSLLPIVVLGFVLTSVIEHQVETHSVADAAQSARLIASIGIQPRLTPEEVRDGLSPAQIAGLDEQLRDRSATEDLARIKLWNHAHTVVYSDDHHLIGRTFDGEEDVQKALEGHISEVGVVTPKAGTETGTEVGLGKLVEVYVPLRFARDERPAGAFEIYLSYAPIAAAIAHDKKIIALVVTIGLALLWAILFRIVAKASVRLRRQAKENYVLARYDTLTGLPNRTLFRERVADRMQKLDGRDSLAVLLIDVDDFTEVNNTLGNETGDEVLTQVGRRLGEQLRPDGLVARIGGDEYAVLCPRAEGVTGAMRLASKIQAAMDAPLLAGEIALNVDVSIGLAVPHAGDNDLDALLQHADAALALARTRRSRVEVYDPQIDRFDPQRLLLLGQVRGALERGEFELHYQPKLDLHRQRVCGVEALLRWRHPEQDLLMPASFIPVIERTALIGPLTTMLIDQALGQMASWREQGIDLEVAVNLSARNLVDLDLPGQIAAALHRHKVPAERLTLEVTESATMLDPTRAAETLSALREIGLCVSIDDFGAGNASIGYLSSLPANELKIDRSFVAEVCRDARACAIVRSVIDLARNLELRVVAEGIETEGVMERVRELGCDVAQGYFISRPVPAADLARWLRSSRFGAPVQPAGMARAASR